MSFHYYLCSKLVSFSTEITQTICSILVSPLSTWTELKAHYFGHSTLISFFLSWILYTFRKRNYIGTFNFYSQFVLISKSIICTYLLTINFIYMFLQWKFFCSSSVYLFRIFSQWLCLSQMSVHSLFLILCGHFVHWCLNCFYIFVLRMFVLCTVWQLSFMLVILILYLCNIY